MEGAPVGLAAHGEAPLAALARGQFVAGVGDPADAEDVDDDLVAADADHPADRALLDDAFAQALKQDEWKKNVARNAWAEDLRTAAETRKHLDSEYEVIGKMLEELGLRKR